MEFGPRRLRARVYPFLNGSLTGAAGPSWSQYREASDARQGGLAS
jgi:hypothetical protein